MTNVAANNKRIAKNTLMLYIRMFVVMLVSLYTSRVVLHVLGAEDYGINNVVGGIVTMLTFMSHTMLHSAQRFFSIELGRNNLERLKQVFKVNISIYLIIGIIALFLGETVGMWFMHNYMTISVERMKAAEWVLHFAILSFCFSILVLPYRAAIMARENMSVMAYLSILEAILKLGLVYLLLLSPIDVLITYAGLNFIVHILINGAYMLVARFRYAECRFGISWKTDLFREVMGFTGWSFMGHFATMIRSQGINILLNVFCGPVVNAARALAFQVNSAVTNLYYNFYMAVKPQIIKYYSVDDNDEMHKLILRSSRVCFYFVFIIALPLLLETDFVLNLWLKEVPDYTSIFVRLVIINTLIEALLPGLTTAIDATGDIKSYQIALSGILLLSFFISWLFLFLGYLPYVPMVVIIILSVVRLFVQLYFVKKQLNFSIREFVCDVLIPMLEVSILSSIIPLLLYFLLDPGVTRFVVVLLLSLFVTTVSFWFVGIRNDERALLLKTLKSRFC